MTTPAFTSGSIAIDEDTDGVFTYTFSTRPPQGASILFSMRHYQGDSAPTLTVADNHTGNDWQLASNLPSFATNAARITHGLCPSIGYDDGDPLTITFTLSKTYVMASYEIMWFNEALTHDGTNTATVTNTNSVTATSTPPTSSGNFVFTSLYAENYGNAGITQPSGYTLVGASQVWDTSSPGGSAYRDASGNDIQTVTWNLNTTVILFAMISTYKVGGSSGNSGGNTGGNNTGGTTGTALVPVTTPGYTFANANYKRLYGPATTIMDGLWNMDVKNTDRVAIGFEAPFSGHIASIRLYWSDGSGYAGGTGGDIAISLKPANGATINEGATSLATGRRRPGIDFSMSGGVYSNGAHRFAPDVMTSVTPMVAGNVYYLLAVNNDGSPGTNWSSWDMAYAVRAVHVKQQRWLNPASWHCMLKQGSTWDNWTAGGHNGGTVAPILQVTMANGETFGISVMETGNAAGRMLEFGATHPIRERFTPTATRQISGMSVHIAKKSGGANEGLNWSIKQGASSIGSGTISQTSNNYTTTNAVGSGQGVYTWYDVDLPNDLTLNPGTTYDVEFTPQGSSVWVAAAQRNGSAYGWTMPAAFTESEAEHYVSGSWINMYVWNHTSAGSGDHNWRVVLHQAVVAGSITTIYGFGELPTEYPVTSITLAPNPLSLQVGQSETVTINDQNGVPAIGATISDLSGRLATSGPSGPDGRVIVTALAPVSGSASVQYSPQVSASLVVQVSAGPPVPQPASNLTATAHPTILGRIDLAWQDNSSDETGFKVRMAIGGGAFSTLTAVGPGVTSYSVTGLGNSTTRYFEIVATNANGDAPPSNSADATTIAAPRVLTSITINPLTFNRITRGGGQALTVLGNDNLPVAGVVITSSDPSLTVSSPTLTNGEFTVTGISHGTATVTATSGLLVATRVVVVDDTLPAAPTNVAAVEWTRGRINVQWTDSSSNETGFKITISLVPEGPYTTVKTEAAGATSSFISGLPDGATRYIRVVAFNQAGDSEPSNIASATTIPASTTQPAIQIVQQGVSLVDASPPITLSIVDQDGQPLTVADITVSLPMYVTAPRKAVNGAFAVVPVGVGVSVVKAAYMHPTAGLLESSTTVTVTPRT